MIVDAHLDIAYNAIAEGRGFEGPPAPGYALSRAGLVAAGVGLIFPTLFVAPARGAFTPTGTWTYRTAHEASIMAEAQLGYYRSIEMRLLRTSPELREYRRSWTQGQLAGVLLMEGADPIETPSELPRWLDAGVRVIGPAWSRTRYCGGTGAPGGLTATGRELLREMDRAGVILDLTHMADRAVRQSLETYAGPVVASHVGARTLNAGQRQLTDDVAAEVGRRGGMVAISFYGGHLKAGGGATIDDVVRHARHLAEATGGPEHVGIGSDLDGGFDASQMALGKLDAFGDLRGLLQRHFGAAQADGILGGNWLDFLERSLPG